MRRILPLALLLCCARHASPPAPEPSDRDGHGTAWVNPGGPVTAGSRGTWDFGLRVGKGGIPTGGGIVFQVSPFWGWSAPQTTDPDRPGFCTVRTTSSCSLAVGGDRSRMYVMAQVASGAMEEGDTLVVRYGDTGQSLHPEGAAVVEPYAERLQEFFFKTDGDGDGVFGAIPVQPGLQVQARPAVALWVNAPSLVAPHDSFAVTVAALDEAGNCDTAYRGTITITADAPADFSRTLAFGADENGAARFVGVLHRPGLTVFTAVDTVTGLAATSNPVLCGAGSVFHRVFWGDIHGHTGLSDGTGTPGDYYRYARDVAGLDVAASTDHDTWGFRPLRGASWDSTMAETARFHEPGRFITLLGYEWTSWSFGHRNVYFPSDSGAVFPCNERRTDTPAELWKALAPWRAITIAHHVGGGPVATDWRRRPPPRQEMVVEVYSVHGNSECFGCRGMIYSPAEGHFVQDALGRGYRLGFVASGDGHVCHPGRWSPGNTQGLVAFLADTLTREAIWECLTARRVYATSGARILLQFAVNDRPMGSELAEVDGIRRITAAAVGTAPLARLEIVKNGSARWTIPCNGMVATVEQTDSTQGGGDYYYARVLQEDGHQAWSSPVWVGAR